MLTVGDGMSNQDRFFHAHKVFHIFPHAVKALIPSIVNYGIQTMFWRKGELICTQIENIFINNQPVSVINKLLQFT